LDGACRYEARGHPEQPQTTADGPPQDSDFQKILEFIYSFQVYYVLVLGVSAAPGGAADQIGPPIPISDTGR
jgi:hypothetical protein